MKTIFKLISFSVVVIYEVIGVYLRTRDANEYDSLNQLIEVTAATSDHENTEFDCESCTRLQCKGLECGDSDRTYNEAIEAGKEGFKAEGITIFCEDEELWGVGEMYMEGCLERQEYRCGGFWHYYDPHDKFGMDYALGWD